MYHVVARGTAKTKERIKVFPLPLLTCISTVKIVWLKWKMNLHGYELLSSCYFLTFWPMVFFLRNKCFPVFCRCWTKTKRKKVVTFMKKCLHVCEIWLKLKYERKNEACTCFFFFLSISPSSSLFNFAIAITITILLNLMLMYVLCVAINHRNISNRIDRSQVIRYFDLQN